MENTVELLSKLSLANGVSGDEGEIASLIEQELSAFCEIHRDKLGNLICELKNENAAENPFHLLLDAHMDKIGFIVTSIDKSGFLRFDSIGGNDLRILPSSEVTIFGKTPVFGVITSTPPHLASGENKDAKDIDKLFIDTGYSYDEVIKQVSIGDRIAVKGSFTSLLNNRFACPALDDRAAVACLIQTAKKLSKKKHGLKITLLFSSREEVGGQGARVASFGVQSDQAISVDVSFATAPGVSPEKASPLSGGVIIAYCPALSFEMSDRLRELAKKKNIPFSIEVCAREAGSNADSILDSGYGIETAALFIPQRNMHSPIEIISLNDLEFTSDLIVEYVLEKGGAEDD